MADCRKYKEMISPYADGELSGNDKTELQAHLDECASCRSLLAIYKDISSAAAENLAEPPEHLTESIMNKIRKLPIEETDKTAAYKPKKSLRPVIISFVAAAACLALAFIVSPQLFGFSSSTDMTASMPMASTVNASTSNAAASENAMLDQAAPEAAAKSAESAGTIGDAEDGAGADSQMQYGITAATESPLPAPSMTPGLTATARDASAMLKEYYAVFMIEGELPDILKAAAMTNNNDGTYNIEITIETADKLIADGAEAEMGAPDMTKALVIFSPAQ